MPKFTFFLLAFFSLHTAFAQSSEGTASYNKKTYPAVVAELPYPAEVVETAVKNELKKRGYTGKSNKGYLEYKGVQLNELGADRVDLYIKAERKSRKDKDAAVLTILTAKGYDNFIGRSTEADLVEGVKKFSNNIYPIVGDHSLELEVSAQEEVLKKAEKKFTSLQTDSVSLEKKRVSLEQNMVENKAAIQKQAKELEMQKKVLDNLRAKRRKEN